MYLQQKQQPRLVRIIRGFVRFFSGPEMFYRYGAKAMVHCIYRTRFAGFNEHIPEEGAAILVCNHISFMDGLILHTASPRPLYFVIDEEIYKVPFVKYFLDLNGAIPILPTRESVQRALRQVSEALREGHIVAIFPEGSLTHTGNLSRFRLGVEWMLKNDPVPVIPVALSGLWGSILSRKFKRSKFRYVPRSLFRKVSAVCGKPIPPQQASVSHMQRTIMRLKDKADQLIRK